MKKVCISVIDYNGGQKTLDCLESLERLKTSGFSLSIIIVDNYPPKTFVLPEKKYRYEVTILKPDINRGFAGGHNVGMKHALKEGADYVVILNNDTTVDPDLIVNLFNAAEDDHLRGAVVPKIYFAKGHEFHKDRYSKTELGKVFWYAGGEIDWANVQGKHRGVDEVDHGQYDTAEVVDLMTGCCVLFSKKALIETGMLDERYFLYYEDADLNERLKRKGYKIYYEPKAILWHLNAGSTGGSGSKLQDYFISRNRMLFGMKYAPVRSKIALVREGIRILQNGREWQKKGVEDYFLRRFGKGSYAL